MNPQPSTDSVRLTKSQRLEISEEKKVIEAACFSSFAEKNSAFQPSWLIFLFIERPKSSKIIEIEDLEFWKFECLSYRLIIG